jgi:hypothetical protein
VERIERRIGRRPKEDPAEVRNLAIGVVVNAQEHAMIAAAATERDLSASAYLRELGLGERRRSPAQAMALIELADWAWPSGSPSSRRCRSRLGKS